MNDLVTVYITTHNRIEKLKRAINSVNNQTYKNIELIVSDDASSDGTESFMLEYCQEHKNCSYIRSDINLGACEARNKAIFSAKGKYITGLDDDDEFENSRIDFFIRTWNDEYAFSCANFIEKFSDGTEKIYYPSKKNEVFDYKELLFENKASNQIFTLTSRMIDIGGFDIKARRLQDWDTWLRLSYRFGDFIRYHQPLYIMHHDHTISSERVSKGYSLEKALEDLLERNKGIYGVYYIKQKYYVNYLNNRLSIADAFCWALAEKKIINFIRFFYQGVRTR